MRKIGLLFVLAFISVRAMCQADITVTDTHSFVMKKLDDSGSVIVAEDVKLTLEGVYKEKSGKKTYTVTMGDKGFDLGDPLNIVALEDSLTSLYHTQTSTTVNFSEYSINQVFLWLYLLNQKNDDGPTIGRLYIGSVTRPESHSNSMNDETRRTQVEEFGNKVKMSKRKMNVAFQALNKSIDSLGRLGKKVVLDSVTFDSSFKEISNAVAGKKPRKMDTTVLQNSLDKIQQLLAPPDTVALGKKLAGEKAVLEQLKKDTSTAQADLSETLAALNSNSLGITSLKDNIAILQKQFTKDTANLQSLQRQIDILQKATPPIDSPKLIKQRDDLKKTSEQESANIDSLTNQLKDQNGKNDYYSRKIDFLKRDMASRVTAIDSSSSKISNLESQLEIARKPIYVNSSNKEYDKLKADIIGKLKNYVTAYSAAHDLQSQGPNSGIFEIEKVSVQFERGYLERVQVWVQNKTGGVDIYENIYAAGFTSITNMQSFYSMRLFVRNRESKNFIYLSDALPRYDNMLDLYTRDYSPADTVINNYKPETGPITLRKEQNINLFESRIYTDLEGLNENKPNGLVQIEVAKRFNLLTYRRQVGHFRSDFTSLSYLYVYGGLTKIEDKQKEFALRNNNTVENGVIVSPSYISNLDLRRYENLNLGFDVNTFLFDYPTGKFTIYVDFGFRYGHTNLIDSIYSVVDSKPINTMTQKHIDGDAITLTFPKLTFELFSQRRVGFSASYSYNRTYAFTHNDYKQVMSYEKSDLNSSVLEKNARGSHIAELFARVETNRQGNGQLFLRTRLYWQQGDANTFFSQVQVGYNYNIIFRK